MPPNPILICARASDLRSELEGALAAAGYRTTVVGTPADAVAAMRDDAPDLVVAEGLAASGAIGALRSGSGTGDTTPVLIVAPARDVEARIAFLEAGADDVIPAGFARSELEAKVMALLIRSGKVTPDPSSRHAGAEVITFFSPKGGVGTTTLAVNTAVLLAGGGTPVPARNNGGPAIPPSRVLLIDLDLQFGQVATHLNISPRYDVALVASDEAALNDAELARSYLDVHRSGLSVLAAPSRPEADFRVSLDEVQRILGLLQPLFDYIVVDLGSRLEPRTVWMLEQADVDVFVLFPEIAALRATSLLSAFLAETTPLRARTHIVVNHIFPNELLKSRDVENLLRVKPAADIPFTEVDMIRSVNEGVPLVISRPTAPAALAMRQLAQAVIGIEPMQAARTSRSAGRRRIFGRR
jgi:pilus assembly protein CpaE